MIDWFCFKFYNKIWKRGIIMKKRKNKIIMIAVIATYLFGMIGFYQSYSHSLLDCLYATTALFTMSLMVSTKQINIYIEIARWLAIFTSANLLFILFQTIYIKYQGQQHLKNKNLIVLHGNSHIIPKLDANIKNSVMMNQPILWQAKRHIFSFDSNNEMLQYLFDHKKFFNKQHQFYLLTDTLRRGSYEKQNMILCNLAENCARLYWKQYPIGFQEEHIVILGFDSYGRELLNQALLFNVIKTDSHICYHIFHDGSEYLSRHHQLKHCLSLQKESSTCDSLIFYQESWQSRLDILAKADRIILVENQDEENLSLLNEIKKYYTVQRIDMKYMYSQIIDDLWGKDVHVFGDEKQLLSEDVIINESTMQDAMNIHAHYFQHYVCQKTCQHSCLNCQSFLNDWNHLNSFVRYSNVAQADHCFNKIRILQDKRKDQSISLRDYYKQLSDEELYILEEIEHIRWCRYHYLHNWQYDETRNNQKRRHPLLVDYSELDDFQKRKDRQPWEDAITLYEEKYMKK